MWKLLFLAISLVGVFCAEEQHYQQTTSKAPQAQQPSASQYPPQAPQAGAKPGVKDVTAGGRYYGGGEHDHDEHGYHHGHRIFRGFDVPLIDDYICDLDATILVVTNSDTPNTLFQAQDGPQAAPGPDAAPTDNSYNRAKRSAYIPPEYGQSRENYGPAREYSPPREYYGGRDNKYEHDREGYAPPAREYGHKHDQDFDHHHGHGSGVVANADRLRCSVIAGSDEDSCTTCCRLSARRDRSVSKDKIIGFLVDNNQLNYEAQAPAGEGYGDNYGDRKKRSDAPVYGQAAPAPVEIPTPETDNRCVCCAPKRYRPFIFDRFFRRQHQRHHHEGYGGPY